MDIETASSDANDNDLSPSAGEGEKSEDSCAVDSSDNIAQSVCDTNSSFSSEKDTSGDDASQTQDSKGDNPAVVLSNYSGDIGSHSGDGDCDTKIIVPSASDHDNVFVENGESLGASVSSDSEATGKVHVHVDNNYNTFQYWRSPLPEVNIDFDIINGQPSNIHVVAKVQDEDSKKVYSSEMNVNISTDGSSQASCSGASSSVIQSETENSGVRIHTASVSTVSDAPNEMVSNIGSTHVLGQHLGQQHLAIVDGVVQGE